jgi:putative ABC transport system permease protein
MLPQLRTVWRDIRRAPVFTACVVLTLALGVGANTGAFSVLDTLLLKPLPYPEPASLVSLFETGTDNRPRGVAEGNLLDWRARARSFSDMAAYRPRSFGLTRNDADRVSVIQTGMVMADFFRVIAVQSALGRTFTEQEEIAEAPLIVLTDRLWRAQFAADPNVLGRKVWLNEEPRTIIGVMPVSFEYPMGRVLPDAFIPLSRRDYCCRRSVTTLQAVARLQTGVTLAGARSELEAVAAELSRQFPASNGGRGAGMEALQDTMIGQRREPLWLLTAAAALLLAIALANVTGLVLARSLRRAPETAVRIALGAGAGHLARLYFTEAAVWSVAGAAGAWLAASLVLEIVPRFVPGAGQAKPLRLDSTAFAFAALLAAALTLVLGSAPTLSAMRAGHNSILKRGGPAGASRGRIRGLLAVVEIALSVVLLLSTALLLRSFLRVIARNPGFETAHVLRFGIGLPEKRYDTDEKLQNFHHALVQRLARIPGVSMVGAASHQPLNGPGQTGVFQVASSGIPESQRPAASIGSVTPGYFAAMSIPLLEGRDFSWEVDRSTSQPVAIVNQAFVRTYLRGRAPLGTVLEFWRNSRQVVGVVSDFREEAMDREPLPEIFLSFSQTGPDGAVYVVRTRGPERWLAQAVASAVAEEDPRIQRITPTPLSLVVERSLGSRKTAVELVGAFGGLALLLTALGIYGLVAFRAAERSREMAIRAALGATVPQIRRLVFGQGTRIALAGIALGLPLFLLAAPLLRNQIYGIGLADPASFVTVILLVLGVTLAASCAPARHAVRTSPAELLRTR